MRFLFLILKHVPERTWWIHDLYFISCFLFVCFEKYIDQFRFFHFLLILFRSRCMDWILGSMCLYRSCSWINENVQKLYLPLSFYMSLPFWIWHGHSLWQHPLIRNLIWESYFDPNVFGMLLITNEWKVLFLVWILFQWELDESIHLHVLLLLLHYELLHVLLDVKHIVDLFISFVESFSRIDR